MLSTASILISLGAVAAADTIHGVAMFHRHGDRTAKWFGNTNLTFLGADQVFSSGDFFRQRYLVNTSSTVIEGISSDAVVLSQISASVPNEDVLAGTAYSFFQGLYPPLVALDSALATQTLDNGTAVTSPLNGYQFVLIDGVSTTDPNTIWILGDESCPAATAALDTYNDSPSFESTLLSSQAFYNTTFPILEPIMGIGNVTYDNAYSVFDLLNVMSIHNASLTGQISLSTLDTARDLANTHEWNVNYNATQPNRMIGGAAVLGGLLADLNTTVTSKGATKLTFEAGSYNNMMALFGLLNLTSASTDFYGLPNYASAFVFELFSNGTDDPFPTDPSSDLRVRFLFRNGTDADIVQFPLFGATAADYSWSDFLSAAESLAITSTAQWCAQCGATVAFCVAANATAAATGSSSSSTASASASAGSGNVLSNAAAGGIGAAVTLAVVGVLAGLAFLLTRKKRRSAGLGRAEKQPSVSEGSDA